MTKRLPPIAAVCDLALGLSGGTRWVVGVGLGMTGVSLGMVSAGGLHGDEEELARGRPMFFGGIALMIYGSTLRPGAQDSRHDEPRPAQILVSPNGAALSYRF